MENCINPCTTEQRGDHVSVSVPHQHPSVCLLYEYILLLNPYTTHAYRTCLLVRSIRVRVWSSYRAEFRLAELRLSEVSCGPIQWMFNGSGDVGVEEADCAASVGRAVKWDRQEAGSWGWREYSENVYMGAGNQKTHCCTNNPQNEDGIGVNKHFGNAPFKTCTQNMLILGETDTSTCLHS